MSLDFEVDDGRGQWCENCLAMTDQALAMIDLAPEGNVIVFDEGSGRWLCQPCASWGKTRIGDATDPCEGGTL